MDIKTTGSVYANTQNKHSAPGICTDSGLALFKLYRATGNIFYLDLLKDTAHNLNQYMSREDRPLVDLDPGWINERVNMGDWEEVGEIISSSTWAEISNMLTFIEIPAIYVQTDTEFVYVFDHVDVEFMSKSEKEITLKIKNPTNYEAKVKLYAEKLEDMTTQLDPNYLYHSKIIYLLSGEEKLIKIERMNDDKYGY